LLFLLILFPYGKPLPGRAFISVEPRITRKTVARRAFTKNDNLRCTLRLRV
jgi:hypothetical protein